MSCGATILPPKQLQRDGENSNVSETLSSGGCAFGILHVALGALALGVGIAALTSGVSLGLLGGVTVGVGFARWITTGGLDIVSLVTGILGILMLCGISSVILPGTIMLLYIGASGVLLGGGSCCMGLINSSRAWK